MTRNPISRSRPDPAIVIAADSLLRHRLADDVIVGYLARSWPLDERECFAAIDAARRLRARIEPTPGYGLE